MDLGNKGIVKENDVIDTVNPAIVDKSVLKEGSWGRGEIK